MTRDYRIGNAQLDEAEMDDNLFEYRVRVEDVELTEAPAFDGDSISLHTNMRSIAYANDTDFLVKTGLSVAFNWFPERGAVKITGTLLDHVTNARKKYELTTSVPPGFKAGQDAHLARLLWFEWWMRWAIANCEFPAIEVW